MGLVRWTSFQGILVHSNVRFEFGPLEYLFVTPRFHHWHHTAEPPLDRNFAVHLPVIDRIFGRSAPAGAGARRPRVDRDRAVTRPQLA